MIKTKQAAIPFKGDCLPLVIQEITQTKEVTRVFR